MATHHGLMQRIDILNWIGYEESALNTFKSQLRYECRVRNYPVPNDTDPIMVNVLRRADRNATDVNGDPRFIECEVTDPRAVWVDLRICWEA